MYDEQSGEYKGDLTMIPTPGTVRMSTIGSPNQPRTVVRCIFGVPGTVYDPRGTRVALQVKDRKSSKPYKSYAEIYTPIAMSQVWGNKRLGVQPNFKK